MPNDAGKLRVLIATTNGPVEVLLLTEEDAAIGRCVACIGGTTETADIAAAYHDFVVRPTGVIESRFGHSCYRLDVSGRIDAGSSWQLGVLAAHALQAAGRLAEEHDAAAGVLWTTGSVRPVDLTVGGVSHVAEKLVGSLDRLKQEAAEGRRVLVALPAANAADVPQSLAAELAGAGIEVAALVHAEELFDRLAMKLPAAPRRAGAGRPRQRLAWVAAAAGAAALAVASFVLLDRRADVNPPRLAAGAAVSAASVASFGLLDRSAASNVDPPRLAAAPIRLVAEIMPFVSDHDRIVIRDEYLPAQDFKAIALGIRANVMHFVIGQPSQRAADEAAMTACDKHVNVLRANAGLAPVHPCEVYASGTAVVGNPPPLPRPPWIVRNPTVERPFVAADLPLVNAEFRERAARNYAHLARSKAYAVSPSGGAAVNYGASNSEEAMRRALELCGYVAHAACMVIALDDTFVVAVPRLARVAGFYRPEAFTAVPPGARDEIAQRLANANDGWNAVAVGPGGAFGIRLGAGSEQAAVAAALDECGKRTRDCRIAVVGPFLVEPHSASASVPAATP